jgi:uncharacterized membrane protein YccC
MYLNALCSHCGRRIKKISLFVLKPGIITCPGCKKLSAVTGLLKGTFAYISVWLLFCFFLSPLKSTLNDSSVILAIFGGTAILSIYTMSLFLELKK